MHKIGVVTPSFNQASTLEQTIRSVLDQNDPQLLYCICEGGSSDGSQDIIKSYAERIDHIFWGPDKGQSDALNIGCQWLIEHGADILVWINSDDYFLPETFAAVRRLFTEYPDAVGVSGNCRVIDHAGEELYPYPRNGKLVNQRSLLLWDAEGGVRLAQPSTFFRADAFVACAGLDRELNNVMDVDLWIKLAGRGEIILNDTFWSCYRVYPQSKTQRFFWRREVEHLNLFIRYGHEDLLPTRFAQVLRFGEAFAAVDRQHLTERQLTIGDLQRGMLGKLKRRLGGKP